jgi:hypothetical protein
MNWETLVKLLLPIKLRASLLLISLLTAVTKVTRNKYDLDYQWVQNLITDLKYTSQVQAMVELINDKFDPISRRIEILDETETNVTIWGNKDPYIIIAGVESNIVMVIPDNLTTVGLDFVVQVHASVNTELLSKYIKRYVFAGVGFKIIHN